MVVVMKGKLKILLTELFLVFHLLDERRQNHLPSHLKVYQQRRDTTALNASLLKYFTSSFITLC